MGSLPLKAGWFWFLALFLLVEVHGKVAQAQSPHNLIWFVPDGLRPKA